MGKIVKLVNVTDKNNNKFYQMEETETEIKVTYGRVSVTEMHVTYPLSDWDKKYKEKLRKGYEDITDLIATVKSEANTEIDIKNVDIKQLVKFLQDSAKQKIKENYTVAIADVTAKQLEAAQEIVNELVTLAKQPLDIQRINQLLLSLYKTIPRRMSNTKSYLLQAPNLEFFQQLIQNEQSLLDTLQGQVITNTTSTNNNSLSLENFNLKIEIASDEDRERISKETDFNVKGQKIFKVSNTNTEKNFDNKDVKLFYHGSRNENWWNILQSGLKIKPANVVTTGSMYGMGIYFADKAKKSIGYTSLKGTHWAKGSSEKAYLAIFEVNLGKKWPVMGDSKRHESWMSSLNQKKVSDKGYDSVFAKGGVDLLNNEYIIYEETRCTIKYLIELKA